MPAAGAGEQPTATAVVVSDPARPVDAVEEPVHDHQQHRHGEQTGGRLDVEAGTAERADDPHGTEPGDDRGGNADPDAEPDRAALARVGAEEACGDRGDHEDRLQALAKDQEPAVEDHGAVAQVIGCRGVRNPALRGQRAVEKQAARDQGQHRPHGASESTGGRCRGAVSAQS